MPHSKRTASSTTVDPRDAFVAANTTAIGVPFPQGAIDDMIYFRKLLDTKGQRLKARALVQWMRDKHNVEAGRVRLRTLAKQAGVEPWWT